VRLFLVAGEQLDLVGDDHEDGVETDAELSAEIGTCAPTSIKVRKTLDSTSVFACRIFDTPSGKNYAAEHNMPFDSAQMISTHPRNQ
jgi:hypothetical protein